ncbi:MAG: cyclic nucleotide-binding domain-containing protein [Deltaproteobacteria bacterium]|nr:cyclic nucleotide-binding domain-containing protein [Deltaproteobacteria bacterium]
MKNTVQSAADGTIILPDLDYSYVLAEENYGPGEDIINEGDHGNWTAVVVEGKADVFKKTPAGPLLLGRVGPGVIIGDLSMVTRKKNLRTATVRAAEPLVLGILDIRQIYGEFARLPKEFRAFLESADRRLSGVNHCLVEVHTGQVPADVLGERTTCLENTREPCWIREGSAALVREKDGKKLCLMGLSAEDFVGGLPFADFGHEPDGCAVYVSDDFAAEPMDSAAMKDIFAGAPTAVRQFITCIASMVRETSNRASERYFGDGG